ncbi:DNA-directed RNA polymerase subunit alpha [Striga asiatica]|uniref:DNA-directed RNA polymerase subunit alpha n=1 Tax=Striga asiatica TaxID=4170 RepID=A0A5A7QKU8_STRAF|nr:DNA-directed RNA polymerase subunit alpha [Striga asiatica]
MKQTCENLVLASGTRKTWISIQYAIKGFPPTKKSPCFVFAPLVRGTPCSRGGIPKKERFRKKKWIPFCDQEPISNTMQLGEFPTRTFLKTTKPSRMSSTIEAFNFFFYRSCPAQISPRKESRVSAGAGAKDALFFVCLLLLEKKRSSRKKELVCPVTKNLAFENRKEDVHQCHFLTNEIELLRVNSKKKGINLLALEVSQSGIPPRIHRMKAKHQQEKQHRKVKSTLPFSKRMMKNLLLSLLLRWHLGEVNYIEPVILVANGTTKKAVCGNRHLESRVRDPFSRGVGGKGAIGRCLLIWLGTAGWKTDQTRGLGFRGEKQVKKKACCLSAAVPGGSRKKEFMSIEELLQGKVHSTETAGNPIRKEAISE